MKQGTVTSMDWEVNCSQCTDCVGHSQATYLTCATKSHAAACNSTVATYITKPHTYTFVKSFLTAIGKEDAAVDSVFYIECLQQAYYLVCVLCVYPLLGVSNFSCLYMPYGYLNI